MRKSHRASINLYKKINGNEENIPCLWEDPNLFDPEMYDDTRTRNNVIALAKSKCVECPAIQECLEYGLATFPQAMMWGGLTLAELNKLRALKRQVRKTKAN